MNKSLGRLALFGGKPVRTTYLPYGRQSLGKEEIQRVAQVLRSDWITTGPVVQKFEQNFAKQVGAKYAVSVNSGTAALHVGCLSLGLKPGDEVITTPMTFAATANAILYCGAKPVFVDIDPRTLNINPDLIEFKITRKTVGIIPVHFAGHPCDMNAISRIARKHGLWVLEDGAHAVGAKYKGKKIGSISDVTIFSFHPVKNITTGEGGMVVTNKKSLYEDFLMYRTHGITRNAWSRRGAKGDWHYDMEALGFRFNMTEMQAALGICQLKKFASFQKSRQKIVSNYNKTFKAMPQWELPVKERGMVHSWHIYPIRWLKNKKVSRDQIMKALRAENIGVNFHYKPVYQHTYYQKNLKINKKQFPVTEAVAKQLISLPLFPAMTQKDCSDVIKAMKKVTLYYA